MGSAKVRLQIRKRTIESIAAAPNDPFVGYVGFAILKRKSLGCTDFVALWDPNRACAPTRLTCTQC
jgi:hypothetical protein